MQPYAKFKKIVLVSSFFIFLIACHGSAKPQQFSVNKPSRIGFVMPRSDQSITVAESNDWKSLRESILVSGIHFEELTSDQLSVAQLKSLDLLVIPAAAATQLTKLQAHGLLAAVESGLSIFTDSTSLLSNEGGFGINENLMEVSKIHDVVSIVDTLFWAIPTVVHSIESYPKGSKVLCFENETKLPLVVKSKIGKGCLVFSAPLFDPNTDKGYSRFPFFIEMLNKEFNVKSLAYSAEVEMYLDLGMRTGENVDELAESWREKHIKRIHVSGWYYDDPTANYKDLLRACHAQGISVYCWLETPMICKSFWDKHPQWREKTATLRDASVDWRKLMNLADENCRKQAALEIDSFLLNNDWDGVNLAELYFEPSPVGPAIPGNFTPMNDWVRTDFKNKHGFDPILVLDTNSVHFWEKNNADWKKLAHYRKDLAFQSKTFFLDHFSELAKKKEDFELMLTVLDVSITPEVSDNIGEDTENTLSLYKKYNLSLQVEDPSTCWGMRPDRYIKMGDFYRQHVKENNQLLFDCNVVGSNERDEVYFPAQKPSGEEIRQICYYMSKSKARPVFYSEDVVNEYDFDNISTVLARDTKIEVLGANKWKVITTKAISLKLSNQEISIKLNGKPWFAEHEGFVILPIGESIVEFETAKPAPYQLEHFSAELYSANFEKTKAEINFKEDLISSFATFSIQPKKIQENNKTLNCPIFKTKSGSFTVKLPKGKHKVSFSF